MTTSVNINTSRFTADTNSQEIIPEGGVDSLLRLTVSATCIVTFNGEEVTLVNGARITTANPLALDTGIIGPVKIRAATGTALVYAAWA